jgi:hypothetical protein
LYKLKKKNTPLRFFAYSWFSALVLNYRYFALVVLPIPIRPDVFAKNSSKFTERYVYIEYVRGKGEGPGVSVSFSPGRGDDQNKRK